MQGITDPGSDVHTHNHTLFRFGGITSLLTRLDYIRG